MLGIKGLKWLFHRIPMNEATSYQLKSFFYQRVGFLFKNTVSYRIWQHAKNDIRQLSSRISLSFNIQSMDSVQTIWLPQSPEPEISIIIPLFNREDILCSCLNSLHHCCSGYACEIILQDPQQKAETRAIGGRIEGARLVRTGSEGSLIENWNLGADKAAGQYFVFLAPDLLPLPGWLDELIRSVCEHPGSGMIASQITLPNGMILESGGTIDHNGHFHRLGYGANPFHPDFSYFREVECCSAQSFLMHRDLWRQVVGILGSVPDDRLLSGAHLSTAVRKAGRNVLLNPLSKTISFTPLPHESKWQQGGRHHHFFVRNHVKNRKEANANRSHGISAGNILVIDVRTPTPDQDSGSQDVVSYFQILQSLGFEISFIPGADLQFMDKYTPDLQRLGVRCLYAPFVQGLAGYLRSHGREFDLVMLYKVHCAAYCLDLVRRYCTRAKIIFNTVDLHFLREQRQAVIEGSEELLVNAQKTKMQELSLIRKVDYTIVLSTQEREILIREHDCPENKIAVIPLIRNIPGRKNPFSFRKDILFVGGFEHRPNVDAVLFFVNHVWTLIRKSLPNIVFHVIGSKPPEEILNLAGADINVTGYLPDIDSFFHNCRLSVAPLRFGAGLKGKVATSLGYGLPCVATSIAVEGSGLAVDEEILVADGPEMFAAAVIRLYRDEVLWQELSDRGLNYMERHFSYSAGSKNLAALLRKLGLPKG